MIEDIDKAKPEVVVQVEVLQARTDRLRDLGILPMQTATVTINPNATTSTTTAEPPRAERIPIKPSLLTSCGI